MNSPNCLTTRLNRAIHIDHEWRITVVIGVPIWMTIIMNKEKV